MRQLVIVYRAQALQRIVRIALVGLELDQQALDGRLAGPGRHENDRCVTLCFAIGSLQ